MERIPGTRGADPVSPAFNEHAFNCPHCGVYAEQTWGRSLVRIGPGIEEVEGIDAARCRACGRSTLWVQQVLVYPATRSGPLPNPDLPDEIRDDFEEARSIVNASPRGAAALLRLCVQKLCVHLGQPGDNLNSDIAALVKDGLAVTIQKALDVVRVIGNNAVHPGEIDLRDDPSTATALFRLVNAIADAMITQPREIAALYEALPVAAREQVERRDS